VLSQFLRLNNFTCLNQLERIEEDIDLVVRNTKIMTMEALGLHESVEILYHEGVVDWSHHFDASMMTWTKVRG
jgi:hypothetical protein